MEICSQQDSKSYEMNKITYYYYADTSVNFSSHLHTNTEMSLVTVIARAQGFMAVNEPSPRAYPEDKFHLRCHKSLASYLLYFILFNLP